MEPYWGAFALNYRNLAPPLKPDPEDVDAIERMLAQRQRERGDRPLDALLCGVTPALAGLRFPAPTLLLATERVLPMIREVWPGDDATRVVVCCDWLALPCADRRFDVALGDGCFNTLDFPDGYLGLCASLHRVLAHSGILLMRAFVRPDRGETVDAVLADLSAARIPSFHVFKWRLAMALQATTEAGVVVNDIYEAWLATGLRAADLTAQFGWPEVTINTIAAYRGKGSRLSFPTRGEIDSMLAGRFAEIAVREPGYALGERCLTFALSPR